MTTHACEGAMKSFKSPSLTAPENTMVVTSYGSIPGAVELVALLQRRTCVHRTLTRAAVRRFDRSVSASAVGVVKVSAHYDMRALLNVGSPR